MPSVFECELAKLYANGKANTTDHIKHFVLGVSGGADSMALMALFHSSCALQNARLTAVHVNHGLSQSADYWEQFVSQQCFALGIEFISKSVVIDASANLESRARDERLSVFAGQVRHIEDQAQCRGESVLPIVVLGHHAQDMAENYLLRLMRGSSPRGLVGMQGFEYHHKKFWVWRPLLGIDQTSIHGFIQKQKLKHIHDESNDDIRHSRNYIRREVIPALTHRWQGAVGAIRQSQTLCQEASLMAEDIARIDFSLAKVPLAFGSVDGLCKEKLGAMSEYRAKNLLRHWLIWQGYEMQRSSLWTELLLALQKPMDQGQQFALHVSDNTYIGFAYGAFYLYLKSQQISSDVGSLGVDSLGVDSLGVEVAPCAHTEPAAASQYPARLKVLVPEPVIKTALDAGLEWVVPAPGLKMHVRSKPYRMSLKKLFQEWKIPSPLRSRWPVLMIDSQVVFVAGANVAALGSIFDNLHE